MLYLVCDEDNLVVGEFKKLEDALKFVECMVKCGCRATVVTQPV